MQPISSISSSRSITAVLRLCAVAATLALIAAGLYVHSRMVRIDDVNREKSSFFTDRTYDVLFFGSSHMRMGIIPFQLWKDYGITSYNLAVSSQNTWNSYYDFLEACTHRMPKVAVLDVYGCRLDYPDGDAEKTRFHLFFDNFAFSKNKLRAARTLFTDNSARQEVLFPYSLYHNRWDESSFRFWRIWNEGHFNEVNKENGFHWIVRMERDVRDYEAMRRVHADECLENEDTDGFRYAKDFVAFCRKNGIQPVLVYLPPASGVLQQMEANSMQRIADALQVPYYNMLLHESELIDCHTDFYDCNIGHEDVEQDTLGNGNCHLNLSGAIKVTDYVGAILRNEFSLSDHRTESGYEVWNDDYNVFRKYILGQFDGITDLDVLLMACRFEGLSCNLSVKDSVSFDAVEQRLIAQLGNRISVVPALFTEQECDVCVTVIDNETGDTVTEKAFDTGYSTFRCK